MGSTPLGLSPGFYVWYFAGSHFRWTRFPSGNTCPSRQELRAAAEVNDVRTHVARTTPDASAQARVRSGGR
jgi:hypothetical protein